MILIVGGRGAGKREYAKRALGCSDEEISEGVLDENPVLAGLQDIVAKDPKGSAALLPLLIQKKAVICDEVGSGIIPMTQEGRETREAVGRLCIMLAGEAESVVRIVCGIPQKIK